MRIILKKRLKNAWPICFIIVLTILINLGGAEAFLHPDSFAITGSSLRVLTEKGNPGWFMYPAGPLIYLNALLYGLIYLFLKFCGEMASFHDFMMMYKTNNLVIFSHTMEFTWPSRLITMGFSVLGVSVVYVTCHLISQSKKISFWTALLLATSPLWVTNSRFATVDIPMSTLSICTVYWCVWILEKNDITFKNLFILGLLCALSLTMKYNIGLLCAIIFILFIPAYKGKYKKYFFHFVPLGIMVLTLFFLLNPFLLLNFKVALGHLKTQINHAGMGHFGYETDNGWWFHLSHSLRYGFGFISLILSFIGAVYLFRTNLKLQTKLLLVGFPVLFFFLMGFSPLAFQRYMLPLFPFLALWFGMGVKYFSGKNKLLKSNVTIGLIFGLCLLLNCIVLQKQNSVLSREDTRNMLRRLLVELKHSSPYKIFAGDYVLKAFFYQPVPIKEAVTSLPADLSKINIDLLIFDSFSHDRYLISKVDNKNKKEGLVGKIIPLPFRGYDSYYVLEISPYFRIKKNIPYSSNSLYSPSQPDLFFRKHPGPYIEIYTMSSEICSEIEKTATRLHIPIKKSKALSGYYLNNLNKNAK